MLADFLKALRLSTATFMRDGNYAAFQERQRTIYDAVRAIPGMSLAVARGLS